MSWALSQIGTPYVWGGETPGVGFDCSGLVQAAYAVAGLELPRVAQDQYDTTPKLAPGAALAPGDLVFFGGGPGSIDHVGLFVGIVNGADVMVDAPHTGADVRAEAFPATPGASIRQPALHRSNAAGLMGGGRHVAHVAGRGAFIRHQQAAVGSWTGHHGWVGARLHHRRWWPGGAVAPVLALVLGLGGVSNASGSLAVVGTPRHPQLLTCAEEATQFTGTLPRIGPKDIGFGPGYFPQARRLATMDPPNFRPRRATDRVQAPSGRLSGRHGDHDDRPRCAVLRGATEPMVATPRERLGHLPGLFAQARFLPAELPVH